MLEGLRKRYRLLLLSNTNAIHFAMIRENYPMLRHFHDFILSYEVKAMKPNPAIYREAVARAGCDAGECFFTDDIRDYVEAARREGLDARLTIAGAIDSETAASAHALVRKHAVEDVVAFTGVYSHEDAPQIYRDADAYLIMKHNDPCPNVVLEALSAGLPVLYSASGGVPELVGDAAGIGLPVEESFEQDLWPSPDQIADGMMRVMANHNVMSQAARARAVERFGLTAWLDRHDVLFRKLVGEAA
jgi:glycosyltransferase involved in cell wall biosynthesis